MKAKYNPPYIIILTIIALSNIIFSTYFISILLVGVVFKIFLDALKKEYYYLLSFTIFIFLIIEVNQGFKLFSLSLISLFLYYFIIPKLKHLFSSSIMINGTFILSFYLCLAIMIQFFDTLNLDIFLVFLTNFILDIFIIGFIL
ncbi:MAG: hypothetical protein U9N59_04520 [Campylobacterota bacterium]|nr:hypothetical protein [Campylobacterota bacterium]